MKLECDVVKDLYILFHENELSPNVKEAVQNHLENCSECGGIYNDEASFSDIIVKDSTIIEPSKKLDEKILLRLKLRKLKILLAFVITFFAMFHYFQYIDQRENLLYDSSTLEETINEMRFVADSVKSDYDQTPNTSNFIEEFNEKIVRINRDLNFYERKQVESHPYQLTLSFNLTYLIDMLKDRYKQGVWSDRDEKALTLVQDYITAYMRSLTDERLKLNGLHRSFDLKSRFGPYDMKELLDINQGLDQLSYTYVHYNKFPEELQPLAENEIENKLRDYFDLPDAEVKLRPKSVEVIKGYGNYTFHLLVDKSEVVYGTINAYTGQLISFMNHSQALEGELIPEQAAGMALEDFLKKTLGEKNYQITELGINYRFSSNVDIKFYTYRIIPKINGYKLNTSYIFRADARTGIISELMLEQGYPYDPLVPISPVELKISKEEGSRLLNQGNINVVYIYRDTIYIKSKLTGRYELTYKYEANSQETYPRESYINTKNGKEEIPF